VTIELKSVELHRCIKKSGSSKKDAMGVAGQSLSQDGRIFCLRIFQLFAVR
jgi:hypothetical protein